MRTRLRAALRVTLAAMLAISAATRAVAGTPELRIPVDCNMATVCSIQKYVDHDPGPDRTDYMCGRLSSDRHDGTDFRVPDYSAMDRGVAVVAAAPGVVKATRDGMSDVSVRDIGEAAIKGREAGNGVVIDHGDGWETQYSHLKRGSIVVTKGQRVEAGQKLGEIGLSGDTEYPHTHLTVRYQGRAVDPFVGVEPAFTCGGPRHPLWSAAALAAMPYRASGPLTAGFATTRPDAEQARHGVYDAPSLPMSTDALVFWADIWGALAGDVQRIVIAGPDGTVVHRSETALNDSNIRWFAYSGRKRPTEGWQPGRYEGTYELIRGGTPVVSIRETVLVGG